MGKELRNKKGQYAGSIGDGKDTIPTAQHTTPYNSDTPYEIRLTWNSRRIALRERLEELGWEPEESGNDQILRYGPRADQIRPNSIVKVVDIPYDESNPRYEELLFAAESDTSSALVYMAYTERISAPDSLPDVQTESRRYPPSPNPAHEAWGGKDAHNHFPARPGEPLPIGQCLACDATYSKKELDAYYGPPRRPTRNEAGLTIVPFGAHAGDELSTLRSKLSGLHFAKEQLSTGEHEILLLAEGLLAILDEEDPRGYRR